MTGLDGVWTQTRCLCDWWLKAAFPAEEAEMRRCSAADSVRTSSWKSPQKPNLSKSKDSKNNFVKSASRMLAYDLRKSQKVAGIYCTQVSKVSWILMHLSTESKSTSKKYV